MALALIGYEDPSGYGLHDCSCIDRFIDCFFKTENFNNKNEALGQQHDVSVLKHDSMRLSRS